MLRGVGVKKLKNFIGGYCKTGCPPVSLMTPYNLMIALAGMDENPTDRGTPKNISPKSQIPKQPIINILSGI